MRSTFHLLLVALLGLHTGNHFGVEAGIFRANHNEEQGDERQANLHNIAVERELQRRAGRRNGGGGKGKGGKGSGSKSGHRGGGGLNGAIVGRGRPIRFLPDRIDPIPFVNCIPLPPGFALGLDDGKMMGKSKGLDGLGGGGSSKGKGKGKGTRRERRSIMPRERVLKHSASKRGRIRNGRNRGGTRNGARKNNGTVMTGRQGNKNTTTKKKKVRLPYCPQEAPTFFPTALSSNTPLPSFTPLPSITPFPSFTPFPTINGEGPDVPPLAPPLGPPDGPGPTATPGAPTVAAAPGPVTPAPGFGSGPGPVPAPGPGPAPGPPVALGAGDGAGPPVVTPPGTERILVESKLQFGMFPGVTARDPTQEEIDGLMVETTKFFNEIVKAAFPTLDSFEATFVRKEFNAGSATPILVEFDANSFFPTGGANPTPQEIFAVLQDANYQTFITDYVWNSQPTGTIFFDTQQVTYDARVSTA